MGDRLDLRCVRALPYAIIGMTVAIIFEMIGIILDIMTDDFMLTAEFSIYAFLVGAFFCTYRLSNRYKWMHYAAVMFMYYVLISTLDNVFLWMFELSDSYMPLFIASEIASSLPDIFLILGVAFILKCITDEYKVLKQNDKSEKAGKVLRLWVIAQILDMIIIDMALDLRNARGNAYITFVGNCNCSFIHGRHGACVYICQNVLL